MASSYWEAALCGMYHTGSLHILGAGWGGEWGAGGGCCWPAQWRVVSDPLEKSWEWGSGDYIVCQDLGQWEGAPLPAVPGHWDGQDGHVPLRASGAGSGLHTLDIGPRLQGGRGGGGAGGVSWSTGWAWRGHLALSWAATGPVRSSCAVDCNKSEGIWLALSISRSCLCDVSFSHLLLKRLWFPVLARHRFAVTELRLSLSVRLCRAPARADRCVWRAEGLPTGSPSLLAALTLQKGWLAPHILYGSSRLPWVDCCFKLEPLQTAVVCFLVSCADVRSSWREAFLCTVPALWARHSVHKLLWQQNHHSRTHWSY